MPMNTTLVMMRSPPGAKPSSRFASHTWPTISAALRLRLKPCCAVEQKRAVERAADLRGDAQRAAVGLRDVDRLEGLRRVGAQQPLARAVVGLLRGDDLRRADLGALGELRAEVARQVGHRREIG